MLCLQRSKILKVKSMQIYKVGEPWNKGKGQISILLSEFPCLVQAYTKYHYCSLCSSWEINLNIAVKARDDTNIQSQWTVKYR